MEWEGREPEESAAVVKPIGAGEKPEWEEGGPHRFVVLWYTATCRGIEALYLRIRVGLN